MGRSIDAGLMLCLEPGGVYGVD